MRKNFLAVLGGLITAFVTIFIFEAVSHVIYPPPGNIDFKDPEAIKNLMKNIPAGALILVIVAWAVGSFIGGIVTSVIAVKNKKILSIIVGALVMISALINLISITHPVWMWIFGLLFIIPSAYLGCLFIKKKEIIQ